MQARIASRKSEIRTDLSTVAPLGTPYVIFIDPNSACNFQCTFCPTGDRALMKEIGRYQGLLKIPDFEKLISDLDAFAEPIKVLRLYKDGEPLLNKKFPAMVKLARSSTRVEKIDTTTNGALLNRSLSESVIAAGIDRINISIDGLDADQLFEFTGAKIDYQEFLKNIRYLYSIKGQCEIVVKTTREIIGIDREKEFFDMFGDSCDKIFVENTSPCWPDFDVEDRMGIKIQEGIYGNCIAETLACPYIFYSMSVNSDMNVSACFVDWSRELIVGNARERSLRDIWNGPEMNAHRLQHLSGNRKNHSVCGSCGQVSHCGPDSIDASLDIIKSGYEKLKMFDNLSAKVEDEYLDVRQAARKIKISPLRTEGC